MRIQLAIVSDNAIPDILDPNAIHVQKITKLDTISVLFSVPNLSHVENPVRKDMTYKIKDFFMDFPYNITNFDYYDDFQANLPKPHAQPNPMEFYSNQKAKIPLKL